MPYNKKLAELAIYIARKSANDEKFGATKLNKILFFSDAYFYAKTGKTITQEVYIKMQHGPVPKNMAEVKTKLEQDKDIVVASVQVPNTLYTKHQIIPVREPLLSEFSAEEISVVDEVIEALKEKNGTQLSEMSHNIGWMNANMFEQISVATIFFPKSFVPSQKEREHARELSEKITA